MKWSLWTRIPQNNFELHASYPIANFLTNTTTVSWEDSPAMLSKRFNAMTTKLPGYIVNPKWGDDVKWRGFMTWFPNGGHLGCTPSPGLRENREPATWADDFTWHKNYAMRRRQSWIGHLGFLDFSKTSQKYRSWLAKLMKINKRKWSESVKVTVRKH